MYRWAAIVVAGFVGISLVGCAPSGGSASSSNPAPVPLSEAASTGPAVTVGRFTYDASSDTSETAVATAAATKRLANELSSQWKNRPSGEASLSLSAVSALARVQLVPLFSLDASTPGHAELFASSHVQPHSYMAVVRVHDALLTAFDWGTPSPVAVDRGQDPRWGSFSGAFYLDFPAAEAALRSHFGQQPVRVRYAYGPSGYWVIGRANGEEAAVFVGAQGEWPDGIKQRHLYGPVEVMAYWGTVGRPPNKRIERAP